MTEKTDFRLLGRSRVQLLYCSRGGISSEGGPRVSILLIGSVAIRSCAGVVVCLLYRYHCPHNMVYSSKGFDRGGAASGSINNDCFAVPDSSVPSSSPGRRGWVAEDGDAHRARIASANATARSK